MGVPPYMPPQGAIMKVHALLLLLAFASAAPRESGNSAGFRQSTSRVWGKPSFGLRVSIAVEQAQVLKGSPFLVTVIVENISGVKIELKTIPSFRLGIAATAPSKTAAAFGGYWCPVNLEGRQRANKTGLILASPSPLTVEKGASITSTIDLTTHGWDEVTSSWWPARDFGSLVGQGRYKLRLDIQILGSIEPQWVRSNEIDVTIGNPAFETAKICAGASSVRAASGQHICGLGCLCGSSFYPALMSLCAAQPWTGV
jgi:hypothetical protein